MIWQCYEIIKSSYYIIQSEELHAIDYVIGLQQFDEAINSHIRRNEEIIEVYKSFVHR